MSREEIVGATVDREPARRFDEAPCLRRRSRPPGDRIERHALLEFRRIGQPDRDGHHPRLAHAVALPQSTGERHRFVIALRAEELVDVGAVLGEMSGIELLAAGELEDDRDQLDSAVDADTERVRGVRRGRLCGCCCSRDDEYEAEGDRAKPHNASLTTAAGTRRETYTPTRQSAPPNTATRRGVSPSISQLIAIVIGGTR